MKEGSKMSANLYNVQSLLVGKAYRSRSLEGVIVDAEKHPKAVWYDNAEAYLVRIRPTHGLSDKYRTIAVACD
jgi:hypothetical protein